MASDLLIGTQSAGPALDAPSLTLITLGGARLVGPAVTSSERGLLEVGKPLALIAFVCASPGRQARRDLLLDLLWADLEPDAAKHALRQTLWYIKKRVGEGVIAATSDVVSVSDVIAVDRDALLHASEANDHARVVGLYAGEFLPNFATPGGAEFEKWAEIERRRLRLLFLRSAEARVHELLGKGRAREALGIARMARDADMLAQAGWRLVLEVLAAGRDWAQARMEADAFEQLLVREEMELEPASRAQLRVARGGEALETTARADVLATTPAAELVGREREFALLLEGVDSAQRGRGRHIHLRAPAGIGKTRLLVDLQARLRGARTRAALVRCDMGSREIPYAAASEIARALGVLPGARGISPESASALVAMTPSLSAWFTVPLDQSSGSEALRRRADAIAELAAAVADEQALVLLIDDVHWMDADSRAVLGRLAARVAPHHMLLVTSGRPSADGRVDSGQAQVIELHPLTEVQCGELVASIASTGAPSLPRRFVSELWRATRGSPLHVLEMLQLLRERNLLWAEDGEWRTSSGEQLLAVLREGAALQRRIESLSRESRWLLLLLAAAGAPTPTAMLAAAAGTAAERTEESLVDLEQRGLIAHTGEEWELAHDEVGEAIIEHTAPDMLLSAHAALGRWLWQSAANDTREMRMTANHLVQGGERGPLHALFERYVARARSSGDRRPLHALADDLLGRHASAELARGLVQALPVTTRYSFFTRTRVAALAVLAVGVFAIAFAAWGRGRAATSIGEMAVVASILDDSGTSRIIAADLPMEQWYSGSPLSVTLDRPPSVEIPRDDSPGMLVPSPDGKRWLTVKLVPDSGLNDVFVLEKGKAPQRLTFTPGDDNSPAWSPDGRYVVVTTARWRRDDSRYDLAMHDVTTGRSWQLTTGASSDLAATFSPRGHRIAFTRRYWDGSPNAACTVAFDGSDSTCVRPREGALSSVIGWFDDETVIARMQGRDAEIALLRLRDGSVRVIDRLGPTGENVNASADGQWITCRCDHVGAPEGSWYVVPTANPTEARQLRLASNVKATRLNVAIMANAPTRIIDSIAIEPGPRPAVVGVPQRLAGRAYSRGGDTLSLGPTRWAVADSSVARIDPATGILIASRAGKVAVTASLGGWRSTTATIDVVPATENVVLSEDWSRGLDERWTSFGEPRPETVSTDRGPAFYVNGDGSYSSGAFSRAAFDPAKGITLDTRIAVPITAQNWQSVSLDITSAAVADSPAEQLRVGHLVGAGTTACSFGYPNVEGPAHGDSLAISNRRSTQSQQVAVLAPASLRAGGWHDVTLALLPDGRCLTLLDGSLAAIADAGFATEPMMRAVISGMSVGTRVLVGPVTVTQGIPPRVSQALERGSSPR